MSLPQATNTTGKELLNDTDASLVFGSQHELFHLLIQAPVAIAIFRGPNFVCKLANDAYLPLVGKTRAALVGKPLIESLPETRAVLEPLARKLVETGEPIPATEFEITIERDGRTELCYFNSVWQPLRDPDGTINGFMVIANEVTNQVLSKQKLKESEERFQAAIAAVKGILWTNNAHGQMEGEQPGWALLTGQSFEEYQGFGWSKAVHPDDAQPTIDAWHEAVSQRKLFVFEHRLRLKNGSWGRFSIRAIPLMNANGSIREWVGVHTDITEQRTVERSLRESEERFRTLAESLPQLVWIVDEKGRHEYASSKWEEYSSIKPIGEDAWHQVVHPDDIANITRDWTESLATGRLYRSETRLKSRTGQYRWHFVQGEPIRNEAGKITKWIGAFTDIHDQKTLSEKLEKLIEARTRDLQRSNDDLEQFAHVASHDLKEPVRKVRTFSDRLMQEFSQLLPDRAKTYIQKIEEAATRMYEMIDGVLRYSSVSITEQAFTLVNLTDIVRHIENDLELIIREKGAIIEYPQMPEIEGAPVLMHQLFYNLLNNSLKFAKAENPPLVQLSATLVPDQVAAKEWHVNANTDYVQILIQDNGIGFSQDHAEQIFKTFSRLNARDKYEGTGLGLALCKKIVERHHGFISAAGMEGMGAIFKIVLPLRQPK